MNIPTVSGFGFSGPDWLGYNVMRHDAKEDWQKEANFSERMASTQWQRGTADMQAAGINPMLAISQGGAAAPHAPATRGVAPPAASSNTTLQTGAATELLRAQAEKTRDEAAEVRARTPTHEAHINLTRQQIDESLERIQDLRASVQERTASASRQYQQVENLKTEIPRIRMDTTRLMEQARNLAASTTVHTAQEKEIQQRLRADLPNLEKLHRELQIQLERIQLPGRELDADTRESFTGILGAYARALQPFAALLGGAVGGGLYLRNKGPETTGTIIHRGERGGPTIHRR